MQKHYKLLFLAVLSQCMIDNIEDGIGEFKKTDKQFANTFLNRLMAIMNKDFGSSEAVHQLVELTVWIQDMFEVLIKAGELNEEQTKDFQKDWEILLDKYNLTKELK